jgi:hypothetical protein
MGNTATGSGQDAYIDQFGALTVENTIDELKALYEPHGVIFDGVFSEADTETVLDLESSFTDKAIVYKYHEPETPILQPVKLSKR